jgi:gliding motility-associated-like protein
MVATSTINNVLCNGSNTGSASATPFGGTPPYTYQWSPSNQTTQTATGLGAGTYTVVVTDGNNCTVIGTVIISEPPPLSTTVSLGAIACNGGTTSATVTASGGTPAYTYVWGTTPVQTSPTATGLTAGTYSLLVTDANGCTFVQNVSLTQPSPLSVSVTSSGAGCGSSSNGTASASGNGGTSPYTYLWSNGQTTSTISNLPSGNYGVVVTDANGCTSTANVTVTADVQPIAAFKVDSSYSCEGIAYKFTDQSMLATSVVYSFGDGTFSTQQNPVHIYPYNGTYTVSLIATNPPCKDTATAIISIGDMSGYVKVGAANIFTPNADGINDCFYPSLIGPGADTLKHCFYIEVFDRWGVKMFETNDINYCWDGNNQQNGKPVVDGTYYYIARLGKTTIRGHVALVRKKN